MSWTQLSLDILLEFAEHQERARALVRLADVRGSFVARRAEAVSACIARKQQRGCPKLAESRRRASAAFYERLRADPVRWAAHQAKLRARYGRAA